jgi:hypothetical protein
MSLNLSSARSYNNDRHYSVHAIWVIQRHRGISTSGSWDDSTIRAVYDWQGSPDRITALTKDGKFGPKSLGCLLAEMRRGPITTDIAHLNPYPHTLPGGVGPDGTVIVPTFTISNPVSLDLRGDGAGWQFRGRFRVNIRLNNSLANPNRYQYRQYIKGTAQSTPGRFAAGLPRTLANWTATSTPDDQSSQFGVPGGGLHATQWREDGVVSVGGTRKYGYRSSAAFVAPGEEDRYLPDQPNGKEYVCVDTYGMMGSRRVLGTRLELNLQYKGAVVDVLNSDRVVIEKTWSYSGDDIFVV